MMGRYHRIGGSGGGGSSSCGWHRQYSLPRMHLFVSPRGPYVAAVEEEGRSTGQSQTPLARRMGCTARWDDLMLERGAKKEAVS